MDGFGKLCGATLSTFRSDVLYVWIIRVRRCSAMWVVSEIDHKFDDWDGVVGWLFRMAKCSAAG